MLHRIFDELPPACKEVYQLSLEGKKHEEIAKQLHISINTVKKNTRITLITTCVTGLRILIFFLLLLNNS